MGFITGFTLSSPHVSNWGDLMALLQGGPPTSYKWSYKPYKWPYKWVTGVITLLIGVITPFTTIVGAHLVELYHIYN